MPNKKRLFRYKGSILINGRVYQTVDEGCAGARPVQFELYGHYTSTDNVLNKMRWRVQAQLKEKGIVGYAILHKKYLSIVEEEE
jgi:hypothetical protein